MVMMHIMINLKEDGMFNEKYGNEPRPDQTDISHFDAAVIDVYMA